MRIPRPPKGSGPSARRLWNAVQAEFELGEHERALLTAMCRQVDRLDELEALITAEGLMVSGHGTVKMHPAVVEARQSAIAVARIGAALRLPAGEEDEDAQPGQRRAGGARCVPDPRRRGVRRRRTAEPPRDSAAGVLLAYEREYAAAAAGDARAAGRLVSVRSWRAMLRASGNDPEVAEFFAVFAREDG